jgi:hypothetical protein
LVEKFWLYAGIIQILWIVYGFLQMVASLSV